MTEEEAFEEISEIRDKYLRKTSIDDGYEFISAPISDLKLLLNIAGEHPEGKVFHTAVEFCFHLLNHRKPRAPRRKSEIGIYLTTARHLTDIMNRELELKEEALALNKIIFDKVAAFDFDKSDVSAARDALNVLNTTALNDHDLADNSLSIIEKALQSDKNDESFFTQLCETAGKLLEIKPELSHPMWEIIKSSLLAPKSDNLLGQIYPIVKDIVYFEPHWNTDMCNDVFNTVTKLAEAESADDASILGYYKTVYNFIGENPDLTDKFVKTAKNHLKSGKHRNHDLLEYINNTLCMSMISRPQYVDELFDLINNTYLKNNDYILSWLYANLEQAIGDNPKLADRLLESTQIFLETRPLSYVSANNVYSGMGTIAKIRPELAEKILSICPICERSTEEGFENIYYALVPCIKRLPLQETIAAHPDLEQELRIAHKGRFASDEEIIYALDHFNKAKLAAPDSKIFHYQQADFSMLLEREAALDGISGKEICRYRHADASEEVKQFYEEQEGWIVPSSFKTSQLFVRKAQEKTNVAAVSLSSFLDKAKKCGLSPHDAVDMLPEPVNPEVNARVVGFIHRNLERVLKDKDNLNDLKLIINNWNVVEDKLQTSQGRAEVCRINDKGVLTDNLDYQKVLKLCRAIKYQNQRSDFFAIEAASRINNVSAHDYHKYEDIYLAGLKVPEPFDSKKEFKCGDYTARFLPREDPRVGFFGNYTDCCQHFGGIGHDCAVSTVMQPFSQLFVVENKQGEIIAGSWVWENTEGKYREACFDNIEIKGDFTKDNLYTLREERNNSVAHMIDCLDEVDAPELINLWREYFQILRDCDIRKEESAETKKELEHLKNVSQAIDNKLQTKEVKSLPQYAQIVDTWTKHKTARQYYENHRKVANAIESLYKQAGEYLISPKVDCRRVTIGEGRQDVDISNYARTESIGLPQLYGNKYSDAEYQVLLAANSQAEPLDKSKESQRYIRDVCWLDIPAMEEVCAEVFPTGDTVLARPDNDEDLAGFVIEDREKGVVGYCLYENRDDNTYYISDTAVLDEYRGDKNASSKKLFAQVLRCVRKKGGTWYAEMREETSLRYLKAMTERGLAKYDILSDSEAAELGLNTTRQMEYDPKLNVASMVYPVRFEVVRDDVRQATAHAHSKIAQPENSAAIKPIRSPENTAPNQTMPRFTTKGGKDAENSA